MAVAASLPSIEELNRLSTPECVAALAPLFEGAPRFLARLANARPFAGYAALWPAALQIAQAMPELDQVELIDAHPRLGAPPPSVSAMSFHEQGYDREPTEANAAAERLAAELERLNAAYERRFGFRFCVFVNGRSRAALVPVIAAALEADRATEIRRALGDVVAIAADRARMPAKA
ncbi:MAG: 2-oxo-4-hydroxy-4-carboxy-5-ureidoimidazoline decarboxylase [Candidatus Limnocylindrales bacterium]